MKSALRGPERYVPAKLAILTACHLYRRPPRFTCRGSAPLVQSSTGRSPSDLGRLISSAISYKIVPNNHTSKTALLFPPISYNTVSLPYDIQHWTEFYTHTHHDMNTYKRVHLLSLIINSHTIKPNDIWASCLFHIHKPLPKRKGAYSPWLLSSGFNNNCIYLASFSLHVL